MSWTYSASHLVAWEAVFITSVNMRYWSRDGLMLDHRLRCWSSIKTTDMHYGPWLKHHWANIFCMLRGWLSHFRNRMNLVFLDTSSPLLTASVDNNSFFIVRRPVPKCDNDWWAVFKLGKFAEAAVLMIFLLMIYSYCVCLFICLFACKRTQLQYVQ